MSYHFKLDQMRLLAERFAKGQLTRRQLLTGLAGFGVVAAFAPLARGAWAQANELIICNWGGVAVENFQKAFADPFTAATGVKATVVGDGPAAGAIRAMVDAGNATWDVCDTSIGDSKALGGGGYLEPIDYAVVGKDKVPEGFAVEFGIANYFFSNVLMFDTTKVPRAPTSWADFFDTKTFPGKRTLCKWIAGQLEAALFGDGVTADQMYPIDVERSFAKIKGILPDLIFWEGGAQSQQLFRDGEVVMGNLWHTRASLLSAESGGKFDWIWNQGVLQAGAWNIPKGNPAGAANANKFVASSQDPAQQIALLDLMANGPANPAADALMTDAQRKVSPASPANAAQQLVINTDWYGTNEPEVQNQFLDLIAS
jgi:putative spermidine/putrescine transport system substrate-binding protein